MLAKTKDRVAIFDAKQGNKTAGTLPKGTTFEYAEQSGTWLRLLNNTWVNAGNAWQFVGLISGTVTPPDVPPVVPVGAVHVIVVSPTGTMSIDGLRYE